MTIAGALPQIITGSATLIVGLGAASLTLWMTGRRQQSEREEARDRGRRREQRLAIVEVIDAGLAWVKSQDGVIQRAFQEYRVRCEMLVRIGDELLMQVS